MIIQKKIGSYSAKKKCSCTAGHFHCGGKSLLLTKATVEGLSKYKMTGFSGQYSASSLKVPQVMINDKYLNEQELNQQKAVQQKACCKKQNDANFENIFE